MAVVRVIHNFVQETTTTPCNGNEWPALNDIIPKKEKLIISTENNITGRRKLKYILHELSIKIPFIK